MGSVHPKKNMMIIKTTFEKGYIKLCPFKHPQLVGFAPLFEKSGKVEKIVSYINITQPYVQKLY